MSQPTFQIKQIFDLAKSYFLKSDDRVNAWLLLGVLLLAVVGSIACTYAMMWWGGLFFAALTGYQLAAFYQSLWIFVGLVTGITASYAVGTYAMKTLSMRWRNHLTHELKDKFTCKRYLEMKREGEIDNPGQRFDLIETYTTQSLKLLTDLIWSAITVALFLSSLWTIGGAISFTVLGMSIVVPGYLVWMSLGSALISTVITHYLGKEMMQLNQQEQILDASLRDTIQLMDQAAENIALEGGEHYFQGVLNRLIDKITQNSTLQRNAETSVISFRSFYTQIAIIFPYLVMSPLYFSGKLALSAMMQVSMMFGEAQVALNFFMEAYEDIADYRATVARLSELYYRLEQPEQKVSDTLVYTTSHHLMVKDVEMDVNYKKLGPFTFWVNRGDRVLLKAPSGFGKSTLFKIIRGTWTNSASGEVMLPESVYCMPQTPTIPCASLREVLAYPDPIEHYTDAEYSEVLQRVQLFRELSDEVSNALSGGEKQRIAFARVLLKKPGCILLDEVTSALDNEAEAYLYRTLIKCLPDATILSIAHRDTVEQFHNKTFRFGLFSTPSSNEEIRETRPRSYSF